MEKLRSKSFYNFPKTRTSYFPMTPLSHRPKILIKFPSHHFSIKEFIHSYRNNDIHSLTPNKTIQNIINNFSMKYNPPVNNLSPKKTLLNGLTNRNNSLSITKQFSHTSRNSFRSFHSIKPQLLKSNNSNLGIHIKSFAYFKRQEQQTHKKTVLSKKPKPSFCINDFLPLHLRKPEHVQFINHKHYYINSKLNIQSYLLGKLSLFLLISSQGENPEMMSTLVFNFITNYFAKSKNIPVCQKRDNYYTIISSAFTATSHYIQNHPSFNGNKTGAACLLLLIPHSMRNKVFCANLGDAKAVLLGYGNPFPLSYQHVPSLESERERIESSEKGFIGNGKVFCKGDEDAFGLNVTRGIGWFKFAQSGITCEPEIIECDVYKERGRCIVIGNNVFWEWLNMDEVNGIMRDCYRTNDADAAGRGFLEKIAEKWIKRNKTKKLEEINGVVILFK